MHLASWLRVNGAGDGVAYDLGKDGKSLSSRETVSQSSLARKHEGLHVLLVEETRFYSAAIRDRLEAAFGVCVTLCTTFEGLKAALNDRSKDYRLVVLDLCQPDAGEGEALDFVVARQLPAIVFSGISSDAKRSEISARHAAAFIAKSSIHSIDELLAAVDRRLSMTDTELLVIEPDRRIAATIKGLLADRFPVFVVNSVREALARLDGARGIELALLRAETAAADNFIEQIRNGYGDQAVRLIGYATTAGSNDVARFLAAGGDEFFHLPISSADLVGRLEHLLSVHRQIIALQQMASRDFLTDLLNRRYFYSRGPRIVDMHLRQARPVSMALVDIDHFKQLNDSHGHEIGDVVLRAVARTLRELVGEKPHLVARLGGEEFGILFAGLDIQSAYAFCEHIRAEVARMRVSIDDNDLAVTISIGLANITAVESFDNYMNAADQFLYLAKHSGRNRVFSDCQVATSMAS
jgi:diguanylate cyclase (GGDEF)-like protein